MRRSAAPVSCVAFWLAAALSGCGATPETGTAPCPPAPDAQLLAAMPTEAVSNGDAARGAALFERDCARCHSADLAARASRFFRDYPRLDCEGYLSRVTDRYLFTAIAQGGPAVGRKALMKPFAETLNEQEIADLVAFLRAGT